MPDPITVDIPHKLTRETARARLEGGIGKVADMIPGGAVTDHRWEGDTVFFTVEGMGQRVASRMDVGDDKVHAVIDLPPMLALFANKIRDKLTREGPKLLK
ncbi:polyhydroxyalkanoic acid system family protein [Stakelama sp. CBK3Z-3]|uniref:Polyhydroxyalkanoic acid system family protein n=1 Tax=Stakelama flava TaxID=2860338 RepID=A0ABS6XNZ6_9SPHN|nr:polyhydroxyalkanoic acid system family protein [Stakelama flava]MBW4331901.1 polyhydroxyalkanoic acid system family protein [Stakelama flava]